MMDCIAVVVVASETDLYVIYGIPTGGGSPFVHGKRHATCLPETASEHVKSTGRTHPCHIPSLNLSRCRFVSQRDLGLSLIQWKVSWSAGKDSRFTAD